MFYMSANGGGAVSAKSSCLFWLFYHDYRYQKIVNLCVLIENFMKMSGMQFNKPRFDWEAKDRLLELEQFKQECNVLFQGPLSEMKDPQKAGLIVNWIGRQYTIMLHSMNVSLDKPETVFETVLRLWDIGKHIKATEQSDSQ